MEDAVQSVTVRKELEVDSIVIEHGMRNLLYHVVRATPVVCQDQADGFDGEEISSVCIYPIFALEGFLKLKDMDVVQYT